MKRELRRKNFEELIRPVISEDDIKFYHHIADLVEGVKQEKEYIEGEELPDYPDIPDEEMTIRVEVFLRGFQNAENLFRKVLNNLSFQVNRKIIEGCQGEELLQFYNEKAGAVLNAFVF